MAGRIDAVIRGAGVVVVAGVLAGGGAYVINESGGAAEANAFINTDVTGDTCTRSSTLVTFEEAQAANHLCGTFDEAHAAANNGDLILIRDGSYNDQTLNGPAKSAGAQITFRAENDGGVIVDSLDIHDVTQLTFEDFTVSDPEAADLCCANNTKMVDVARADSIVFDGVDINRNYNIADGLGISGDVNGITFRNGDICCNKDQKLIQIQPAGEALSATDVLFENVTVHDQVYSATSFPGEPPHAECWWLEKTTNITLRNVRTYDCISTGDMNWGGVGNTTGLLFQNTFWGVKYGFENGVDVVAGAGVGYRGDSNSNIFDGANTNGAGTVEYSIFEGDFATKSGWSSLTFRGNITKLQSCGGTWTYTYNKHTGADCSASDIQLSTVMDAANFVDSANQNWRPSSCSAPQVNAGDTANYPATDADGVTRYVGSAPDLGLYEKTGC